MVESLSIVVVVGRSVGRWKVYLLLLLGEVVYLQTSLEIQTEDALGHARELFQHFIRFQAGQRRKTVAMLGKEELIGGTEDLRGLPVDRRQRAAGGGLQSSDAAGKWKAGLPLTRTRTVGDGFRCGVPATPNVYCTVTDPIRPMHSTPSIPQGNQVL